MRQGPHYGQWVDRDDKGNALLRLPLELEHEWENFDTVLWTDNGDGTYTLRPERFKQ